MGFWGFGVLGFWGFEAFRVGSGLPGDGSSQDSDFSV